MGSGETPTGLVPEREGPLCLYAGSERHRRLDCRGLARPLLVYVCLRTGPSKVADDSVSAEEAQGFSLILQFLLHQVTVLFGNTSRNN